MTQSPSTQKMDRMTVLMGNFYHWTSQSVTSFACLSLMSSQKRLCFRYSYPSSGGAGDSSTTIAKTPQGLGALSTEVWK